ncbi:cobyrinate a,c-diamide synthase, partial [Escherichia coli]|nr:cobyrinate a,c-diamide synthase [Escherichia coli]
KNDVLRGHEFHYSRIVPMESLLPSIAKAFTAKGGQTDTPLYRYKNVLAGYTHLYWGDPCRNDWFIDFLYGEAPDCSR